MTLDFDPNVDHYKVLGVEPGASSADIKKAYRKLAKANHPDSTGGDKKKEARFKEISSAYEVLGDEAKRKQYDEIREQIRSGGFRSAGARGQGGGAGPQVFDLSDLFAQFFSGQQGRGGAVHIDMDDMEDFGPRMRQTQGRARAHARSAHVEAEPAPSRQVRAHDGSWLTIKGSDVHSDVRLPFQDAILGTVRDIATVDGTAKMKIPPGTSSGVKLRLRGKGVAGPGGEPGDHYVTVQVDIPKDLDEEGRRLLHELVTHLKGQGAPGKKRG